MHPRLHVELAERHLHVGKVVPIFYLEFRAFRSLYIVIINR